MGKKKLLVIDDDPGMQMQLRWCFDAVEVLVADCRESALAQMRRHQPAVVTLDLALPPAPDSAAEGLATLQDLLRQAPDTKVIILTGHEQRANTLRAVALGACDVHQKPFDPDILRLVVERAFTVHALQQENRRMLQIGADSPLAGIVTRDHGMLRLCRSLERVAPSAATVLLLGDSGSGKAVLARALHQLSIHADGPFIAVHCAAMPEELLLSELFGDDDGAYAGTGQRTPGKIEQANGGTLFLDEIGDLPPSLQARLLRYLQQRVIERIGQPGPIPNDARLVCATQLDLPAMVGEGRFREELWYRLREIVLAIPALHERVGDAVLLAHHFRNRHCASEGRALLGFSDEALAAIEGHAWPGNVRELESCIKRAVIMAEGPLIGAAELGLPASAGAETPVNLRQVREAADYRAMVLALARADGNIVKAAELLGVSRPTLYDLMHHHGLRSPSR